MNVKIAPELEWVRPYLKRVKDIVPVHRLEKIVAIKATKEKVQRIHGQLVSESWEEDGLKHRKRRKYLTLYVTYNKVECFDPLKVVVRPYSKIDLLSHLAHELAHFSDDKHTPEHKKLENRLCSIFMTMLSKDGYSSEEFELKYNRPKYPAKK